MKTLLLLRHAKSSWDASQLSDHERPLNARGRKQAPAIGNWISSRNIAPDEVLCSDATRTRETWERLGQPGTPDFRPDLYHAGPAAMSQALQGARGSRVMILAHNPGIAEFAERCVVTPPDHPRFWQFPTASLLVATFDIPDWREMTLGTGQVQAFLTPHDLGIVKT